MSSITSSIPKKPELRKFRKVIKARRRREAYVARKREEKLARPYKLRKAIEKARQQKPQAQRIGFFSRILKWFKSLWVRKTN